LRLSLDTGSAHVREVFRSFGPVVLVARGGAGLGLHDQILAQLLGSGAVASLNYAQTLYTRRQPLRHGGFGFGAAEMSRATGRRGHEEVAAYLRGRLLGAAPHRLPRRPSAWPSSPGDVVAGLLFQTGRFGHSAAVYVWAILAGSAVGLLASTLGRL